eukprot:scaffold5440_cov32-Tisochrysis_lutea.AAC.3
MSSMGKRSSARKRMYAQHNPRNDPFSEMASGNGISKKIRAENRPKSRLTLAARFPRENSTNNGPAARTEIPEANMTAGSCPVPTLAMKSVGPTFRPIVKTVLAR